MLPSAIPFLRYHADNVIKRTRYRDSDERLRYQKSWKKRRVEANATDNSVLICLRSYTCKSQER